MALLFGGSGAHVDRNPRSEYRAGAGAIVHADGGLAAIVPDGAVIEHLATGFSFLEGPVWVDHGEGGHLVFSDLRGNALHRWYPDGRLLTTPRPFFRGRPTGNIGPNGLTIDAEGRLVVCDSGNRRIVRQEQDGTFTVLVDRFRGRRLNSPNDLVYRSDGSLYFTDPPHGLRRADRSPLKELPFNGVYRLRPDGTLDIVASDLFRPNGIALSPDERELYVTDADPTQGRSLVRAYAVTPDGRLGHQRVLRDVTALGGGDGVKVDRMGHIYVATLAGVAILNADGRQLGLIRVEQSPSNLAWGENGSVLYVTARTGLYRVRLSVAGVRPSPRPAAPRR